MEHLCRELTASTHLARISCSLCQALNWTREEGTTVTIMTSEKCKEQYEIVQLKRVHSEPCLLVPKYSHTLFILQVHIQTPSALE